MYPNLKLQMWRLGLRQNRLAQLVNVDETTLSRIVNGFRRPGDDLKARIAAALKSEQEWLFEETKSTLTTTAEPGGCGMNDGQAIAKVV